MLHVAYVTKVFVIRISTFVDVVVDKMCEPVYVHKRSLK